MQIFCASAIDWMLHLLFYPDKSQVYYCDITARFLISFLLISNEICAHCETEQQKELQQMSAGIRFSWFINAFSFINVYYGWRWRQP